jgi:hypothetical protein
MEISAETSTELTQLFEEILSGGAQALDLAACERRIAGCQRVESVTAAVHAELLLVHQRLLAEAARVAAAEAAAEDAANGGDGGANASDTGPDDESSAPPPQPKLRESPRARQQRLLRSKWLQLYPALAEALTVGRITPEHVDALAGVFERTPPAIVAEFDEAWLVQVACTYPPEGFASFIRDEIIRIRDDGGESEYQRQLNDSYAWMGIDKTSGMYLLKLAIDPLRGQQLQSAIDQRVTQLRNQPGTDKLRHAQLCLQAVWDLIMEGVTITPDSIVVVDHQTATTGRQHPHTVCQNIDGVPLPVSAAVQAAAVGNITAAILDRSGKVIDYGCSSALADRTQRSLQRAMYEGCAHPDCDVPSSRCEIHHVIYRQQGGKTVMSNLVPLCVRHHHQLHDDHWTLTMDDDRTLRWYRPDRTPAHTTTLTRLDHRDLAAAGAREPSAESQPPGDPPGDPPDEIIRPPGHTSGPPRTTGPPGDDPPQLFDPRAA